MKKSWFLFFVSLIPSLTLAAVCDTAWDGDKFIDSFRGSAISRKISLQSHGTVSAEVTVGQVQAFYEAKEKISKVVGLSPSFIICGDRDVNAFASSGGQGQVVGVTVGMLKLVDGNANMAAAVIGHEFAHHVKGHGAATQSREAIAGLFGLLAGIVLEHNIQKRYQISGAGIDLGQMGSTLVSRKFGRDQEREADRLGLDYMVRAGFNPIGSIQLANKMTQAGLGGAGLFFDSHPGWSERESDFRTMIASNPEAQRLAATRQLVVSASRTKETQSAAKITLAPTYTTTDAQKSFAAGAFAYRNGDIVNAVREFRSSADAGYAVAQNTVGFLFSIGGGGLPKDEVEAVRLYRLAIAQGNASALNNLGNMYSVGRGGLPKDDVEAVRLYRAGIEAGDAYAHANLGNMYASGRGGLPRDEVEALRLHRVAANLGNPSGQVNLGAMHASGQGGLQKDEVEAVRLYRLSADQGNATAQSNLGFMYLNGRGGLPKDDTEAVRLFRLAADQGSAVGQANLGYMYANGRGGLLKDDYEAVQLYRLAADQGLALGQALLGVMYKLGGVGLPRDELQAVRLFRLAADQGNPLAQSELGYMYLNGRGGLAKNDVEATRWFRIAADQGNALAQANLGFMYENGRGGLRKDSEAAVTWYRMAARQGITFAHVALKRLGKE